MGRGGGRKKKDGVQCQALFHMFGNPDMCHMKRVERAAKKPGFH
jgi:hypothetical protein